MKKALKLLILGGIIATLVILPLQAAAKERPEQDCLNTQGSEQECPPCQCSEQECPPVERPEQECPPCQCSEQECPPVERSEQECPPCQCSEQECPPVERPEQECPPCQRPEQERTPVECSQQECPPCQCSEQERPPVECSQQECPPAQCPPQECPPVECPQQECPPCPSNCEGLTPGYWKNHVSEWGCYSPDTKLGEVFKGFFENCDVEETMKLKDCTLLEALNFQGGPKLDGMARNMFRHAVAALLNSCSSEISYPYNTYGEKGVIYYVDNVNSNSRSDMEELKDIFEASNTLGVNS